MPFCTQCGHSNTDDARFCSNCGAALKPAAPTPPSRRARRRRSPSAAASSRASRARRSEGLSTADQAAVDALPPGSALLVVRRGPNRGSRFLLDSDTTTAGRHPGSDIFLDDVTVSRRHAEFVRGRRRASRVRDVGSLNGTYVNRERIDEATLAGGDEVQVGKYRLVYYPSQHGTDEPGRMSAAPCLPLADEHRGGAHPAAGRVPRRHDLEDPVPRVRGPGRAGPHPVGLPQVQPRRRRPAALRAGGPARPLPAAAGHQGAPRRAGPRPRAAGRAGRAAAGARARPDAPTGCPARARWARPPSCGCPAPSCWSRPASTTTLLDRDRGLRAGRAGARQCGRDGDYDADALVDRDSRRGDGRLRPRAAAPALVPHRGRPRGRTWSSRSWRRCCGSAARRRGPGPRRWPARWRRCRCGCTPRWCAPRLRDVVGR